LAQDVYVDEVMSADVRCCFDDQPLDEVMIQMADSRIRRVPVVFHDDRHKLIGIVSLGDVETRTPGAQKADVEQVVEMVSSPSEPGAKRSGANDVAGRTGQVSGTGTQADAGTGDPRRNFGVGGQDRAQDRLPPA
jgi:hypothetical protein